MGEKYTIRIADYDVFDKDQNYNFRPNLLKRSIRGNGVENRVQSPILREFFVL